MPDQPGASSKCKQVACRSSTQAAWRTRHSWTPCGKALAVRALPLSTRCAPHLLSVCTPEVGERADTATPDGLLNKARYMLPQPADPALGFDANSVMQGAAGEERAVPCCARFADAGPAARAEHPGRPERPSKDARAAHRGQPVRHPAGKASLFVLAIACCLCTGLACCMPMC